MLGVLAGMLQDRQKTVVTSTRSSSKREELAESYQEALSSFCPPRVSPEVAKQLGVPPLPSPYTEFSQNPEGSTLTVVSVTFGGHTLETSDPVKNRVTEWIASHHSELIKTSITRVCVKGRYSDIDSGSSCLDVR